MMKKELSSEGDPFKKPYWNEMQTLGWVYLRSVEWVRLTDDDNTNYGSFTAMGAIPGGEAKKMEFSSKRPSTITLGMWGYSDGAFFDGVAMFNNVDEVEAEIIKMLLEGELTCLGVAINVRDPQVISSISWAFLKINYDKGIAHPSDSLRQGVTEWHNLKFKSDVLKELWPQLKDKESTTSQKSSAVARKGEMQKDMDELAAKYKQKKRLTKKSLAFELSQKEKYKDVEPKTIERLTFARWKKKK